MKSELKAPAIGVGDRFVAAAVTAFGIPRHDVWQVTHVFDGTDSVEYARLEALDRSLRVKTVALAALWDRRLYRPVLQ